MRTFTDELVWLERMGFEVEQPEESCYGMAGAFGFTDDHYGVAMALGERALVPRISAAGPATVVVADGFSGRERIRQGTGRLARHFAKIAAAVA